MSLTLSEFQKRSAAIAASRAARERGDHAAAVAAWEEVGAIEAESRQRENETSLRQQIAALERRMRELESDRKRDSRGRPPGATGEDG